MPHELCGLCVKPTSNRGTQIRCFHCNNRFHVRCAKINSNQYFDLKNRGVDWLCNQCYETVFPLASLDTIETYDFFNNFAGNTTMPLKSTKCDSCTNK